MPGPLSVWEILIILAVLLLLFGARRLPEMGRSLGRGMREFKDAVTGKVEDEEPAELPRAAPPPPPASTGTQPSELPRAAPPPPPASTGQPSETERVSR
jgi:TatA/E family protein of Tat protein translocase